MKTLMVFMALLLGTALNSAAKDIAAKDTINGWYFWKTEGTGTDTAYTRLTSKSFESKSAQVFGNSTTNNKSICYWKKDLDKTYPFPKFVIGKVTLDSIGIDSIGIAFIEIYAGDRKNPDVVHRMAKAGLDGLFLQRFPRPYWNDFGAYVDTLSPKPDSVNFIVFRVYYSHDNKDPMSEFIVDKLAFAYGKGANSTIDSAIVIDRFGDSAMTPVFKSAKTEINFGEVAAGDKEIDSVSISNQGEAPMSISRIWTSDPRFSAKCSKTSVDSGYSSEITVEFTQDSTRGSKRGSLFIEYRGMNKYVRTPDWSNLLSIYPADTTSRIDTIQLVAEFEEPVPIPELSVSPKLANFGILEKDSSKNTVIIFRNFGNDTVRGNIEISGNGFSLEKTEILIPPADSTERIVRFSPDSAGNFSGMLLIRSNSPSSPDTVFLSGVGEKSVDTTVNPPELPRTFSLSQNYPNPFNPSTTIEFTLPKRANVNLAIYNVIGQQVETIVSGELSAETHRYVWNAGRQLASGIYFYRLETSTGFRAVKKMLLVK